MVLRSVDFPFPFFPIMPSTSPFCKVKEMFLKRIFSGVYPKLKSFTSSKTFAGVSLKLKANSSVLSKPKFSSLSIFSNCFTLDCAREAVEARALFLAMNSSSSFTFLSWATFCLAWSSSFAESCS